MTSGSLKSNVDKQILQEAFETLLSSNAMVEFNGS